MAYRVPNNEESEELLVAQHRALFPNRNIGARRSYHRRRAQWLAAALTELHSHQASAANDFMPDTATGSYAERWGRAFGTKRKGATPARRDDALRVRGDEGTTVPKGLELVHEPSGLRFQVDENEVIPVSGEVDVDVVAIDTGSRTRLTAGEILTIQAVPAGLLAPCELQLDLDVEGFDEEAESAFKRRYLDVAGEASAGGNNADYKRWLEAIEGIDVGYPYPSRAGRGTIDLVAIRVGRDRALSESELDAALVVLEDLAPSQVAAEGGSMRLLEVVPDEQDIELVIRPIGDEFEMDWSDEAAPIVATWTPATRVLTFTTDRPGTMAAGDRLCIHGVASEQTGEVLRIDSLIGDDGVKLEVAPEVAPVATDIVYAAGPLTETIREAIIAHMRGEIVYAGEDGPIPGAVADEELPDGTVGLKILAEPIGPANPDGRYGPWSGAIVQSVIEEFAIFCRGVRNATCLVPADDYEAEDFAFPDDAQIGLVVPGEVLVRRSW